MDFFAGDERTMQRVPGRPQARARGPAQLDAAPQPDAVAHRVAAVRATHEAELMRYPNVVGVSEGIETKRGKPTGRPCVVVYVTRKVSKAKLTKGRALPDRVDGIPVDVVEVGAVQILPK
jgi:hypothetical protein